MSGTSSEGSFTSIAILVEDHVLICAEHRLLKLITVDLIHAAPAQVLYVRSGANGILFVNVSTDIITITACTGLAEYNGDNILAIDNYIYPGLGGGISHFSHWEVDKFSTSGENK